MYEKCFYKNGLNMLLLMVLFTQHKLCNKHFRSTEFFQRIYNIFLNVLVFCITENTGQIVNILTSSCGGNLLKRRIEYFQEIRLTCVCNSIHFSTFINFLLTFKWNVDIGALMNLMEGQSTLDKIFFGELQLIERPTS